MVGRAAGEVVAQAAARQVAAGVDGGGGRYVVVDAADVSQVAEVAAQVGAEADVVAGLFGGVDARGGHGGCFGRGGCVRGVRACGRAAGLGVGFVDEVGGGLVGVLDDGALVVEQVAVRVHVLGRGAVDAGQFGGAFGQHGDVVGQLDGAVG
ncbi:hypothetical protein M3765_02470 [Streptomyces thermoviolaceus]|uniref:hypothetical protein n=1 Tax=Streptomyces thermoviolaceus TaxID=1952 RepID=UPI00203A6F6E|nr:hypothetical protein [Streptomyces thermoviolaceus]MCM3262919.1 hypothetical protein [Streptomyces thermoviolaceus]